MLNTTSFGTLAFLRLQGGPMQKQTRYQMTVPLIILMVSILACSSSADGEAVIESPIAPVEVPPTPTQVPSTEAIPSNPPTPESSTDEPDVKFGYSEDDRMMIFLEIVRAEDRATNEAEWMYPTPDPLSANYSQEAELEALENQFDYYDEYAPLYKIEVAESFGIIEDQLREIVVEGIEKDWPFPPSPTPISD